MYNYYKIGGSVQRRNEIQRKNLPFQLLEDDAKPLKYAYS